MALEFKVKNGLLIENISPLGSAATIFLVVDTNGVIKSRTASEILSDIGAQPTGNYITALTGDVTASGPGSVAATLATVNSNVGTFGSSTQSAQVTVNAKGLVTGVTNFTITPAASSITDGATLSKVDDTNVTLTLGGSPTSALLAATSLTLGWSGQLSVARGGTGTNTNTTINGTSITYGTTNTITSAASTLTGTTLASNVISSSLTSVGTITTGVWQGTPIGSAYITEADTLATVTGRGASTSTSVALNGGFTGTTGSLSGNMDADDYNMAAWKILDWSGSVAHIGGIQGSQWQQLEFYTAAATRMTITSSGNVGIGITTPEQLLDLYSVGSDPSTVLQIRANRSGYGNVRHKLISYAGGSTTTDRFTIQDNGGNNVFNIVNQNVGIGTTSPISIAGFTTLQVEGSTGSVLEMWSNSGGSTRRFQIEASTSAINLYGSSATPMAFWTNAVERGRITSAGRWLFGTTTDDGTSIGQFNGDLKILAGNKLILLQPDNSNGGYIKSVTNGDLRFTTGGASDALILANSGAATFSSTVTATSLTLTAMPAMGGNTKYFTMYDAVAGGILKYATVSDVQSYLGLGSAAYTSSTAYEVPLTFSTGLNRSGNTITNTGVTSITGTANQVIASASTGAVTLSLPQSIATTSNVTFNQVTATNGGFDSDIILKQILSRKPILSITDQVEIIKFLWKDVTKGTTSRYGYVAQQLQTLLPEAVYKTQNGTLAVDYTMVHTVLIDENTRRIKHLEKEIEELKKIIGGTL